VLVTATGARYLLARLPRTPREHGPASRQPVWADRAARAGL